jgi:phosphopantothenoylcysteine decarboxylase/phosphopantothenate--cysteine ligase
MSTHALRGKKILLGVSGSIAAYKAANLCRLLVKAGAEVQVVMTTSAAAFISPLTMATLSKRPALQEYVRSAEGEWNNHVALGLWADLLLVAPASANTLAKMAHGLCDNLLSAVYLSARCPVVVAPAMDLDMYQHGTTKANLMRLQELGVQLIEAESGELASGLEGQGRLAEPERIFDWLEDFFAEEQADKKLKGKKVLITAGPTYETIDPVRFIGNHSTGKMGFALAEAAAAAGAEVTLVSGPSQQAVHHPNIRRIDVSTAREMYAASESVFASQDIAIFAAAVADYRPAQVFDQKIKKGADQLTLTLEKNVDIAASLGARKQAGQYCVGFALETENETVHALEKMERKNFDLVVLNSLRNAGAGFGYDTNQVSIFDRAGKQRDLPLQSKKEIARAIIQEISQRIAE